MSENQFNAIEQNEFRTEVINRDQDDDDAEEIDEEMKQSADAAILNAKQALLTKSKKKNFNGLYADVANNSSVVLKRLSNSQKKLDYMTGDKEAINYEKGSLLDDEGYIESCKDKNVENHPNLFNPYSSTQPLLRTEESFIEEVPHFDPNKNGILLKNLAKMTIEEDSDTNMIATMMEQDNKSSPFSVSIRDIINSDLDIDEQHFLNQYKKCIDINRLYLTQSETVKQVDNISNKTNKEQLIEKFEIFYNAWCDRQTFEHISPLQHALEQLFGDTYTRHLNITILPPENQQLQLMHNRNNQQLYNNNNNNNNNQQLAARNYQNHNPIVTFNGYIASNVEPAYQIVLMRLVTLNVTFGELNLLKERSVRGVPYASELSQLSKLIWYGKLYSLFNIIYQSVRSNKEVDAESSLDIFRHQAINRTKLSESTSFLLHILEQIRIKRLRRKVDMLYCEILDADGFGTCAWQPYMTIRKFISSVTRKEDRFDQWCNMVGSPNVANTAVNYIKDAQDNDIQEYISDWGVVAFKDVLYISHIDKWYKHNDPKKPSHLTAQIYIDQPFDDKLDPKNLFESAGGYDSTKGTCNPLLKILRDQGYNEEEMFIFLAVAMGRNLYKVNELDNWEVLTYIYGLAGTGKSTIVSILSKFFQFDDMARLGNNIQETFGLEAIYDKRFAAASDVTSSFRLGVGDLLSIASGEVLEINRKFKTAFSVPWLTPILFCGNDFPYRWVDKKGNLIRRFFIPDFFLKVIRDNSLQRQIQACVPTIYRLINLCYLKLVEALGRKGDLTSIIPERFKKNHLILLRKNSPLMAFIIDQEGISIESDEEGYMAESVFIKLFTDYCKLHNTPTRDEAQEDRMQEILSNHGCSVVKARKADPPGSDNFVERKWIIGFKLKEGYIMSA